MVQKNYRVINASAGSGKTYTLVLNLLHICLQHPSQADKIKNILALTFTNKAANEMKHRIISWLKAFSSPGYEDNLELKTIQQKLKDHGQDVSIKTLHERSCRVLDYILHNYSTLNIGTIDKFNSRLVRSFAYELGLAQNFNLEINSEPFLVEAVEKMLDDIGEENEVSDAFMDFVTYNLDNDKRVNLNKTLYDSAKEFVQDKHYFRLSQNKDFDWKIYSDTKKKLREDIRNLKEENLKIAQNCLDLIKERNLEIGDFADGANGIAGFFQKFITNGYPKIYETVAEDENRVSKFAKGASGKGKKRQDEILEILDFLLDSRIKIINNYISGLKKEKVLHALLPLKVNKDIQDKLAEIEEKNDVVLLSKFNILIHENLRNEPSSFIYEKVGSQFSHYFFDEFQDTSFLQWQNFIPLRDHAISSEEMSFTLVGDPKQSIYRFRGGDSKVMLDIINRSEPSMTFAELENLGNNWRSAKNIVDFNNKLYQFLSAQTRDEHCEIFGNGSQQIPKSSSEGRVRINLIENSVKSVYYENVSRKMQEDIQQSIDNGFQFSDITILCRGNADILNFAQLLGNLKVRYDGRETYIKTISESGLTLNLSSTILALTEFLRWEQNPKNHQFAVRMLYHLNILGRIQIKDFSASMMEMLEMKNRTEMLDYIERHFGLVLKSDNLLQLNLYNFVEHFLQEFSVEGRETDFLFNYLEMLYAFSQNAGANLKEFLRFWEDEAQDFTIQASDNIDAIKLMTIHKAKGLEFPVVFLPMQNSHKDGKFKEWFEVTGGDGLSSVNINAFDKELVIYDDDIQKFNHENAYQNKIDRFCLQYVATTRAAEQLFLYVEKPTKTSNLELYDFLESQIPYCDDGEPQASFDLYPVNDEQLKKKKKNRENMFVTQSVPFKNVQEHSPDAIKIATPSKSYQNRNEKVRTGIFTHEILAKINTSADIEKTLENYLLEGLITLEEKRDIEERILNIIQDSRFQRYFEAGQKVINEKDVMISSDGESQMYRPDRLIQTEEGFIIIDFKTGEVKEKHKDQIEEYRNVLERLGKKVAETSLIYI